MPDSRRPAADSWGELLLGDGLCALSAAALILALAGLFAVCQSSTGMFLPHDLAYLQMTAEELCGLLDGRVAAFMIHDRVAFGGVLMGVGAAYLWLTHFPLRRGEGWAWWTLLLSGLIGFASFFYWHLTGYLDSWHAVATCLVLLPWGVGLVCSRSRLKDSGGQAVLGRWRELIGGQVGWGRICLLVWASGVLGAGVVIGAVGSTCVFVPEDIEYLGAGPQKLSEMNPRLIPLIAHDRAGFGGALASLGLALWGSIWCHPLTKDLKQMAAFVGLIGFGLAGGVHFVIGYTDFVHLLPVYAGVAILLAGLLLPSSGRRGRGESAETLISTGQN